MGANWHEKWEDGVDTHGLKCTGWEVYKRKEKRWQLKSRIPKVVLQKLGEVENNNLATLHDNIVIAKAQRGGRHK